MKLDLSSLETIDILLNKLYLLFVRKKGYIEDDLQ